MSYLTFSFGCICGPKFQNICLYVTGYLQRGTHLYIHSARGLQTFISQRALSSLRSKEFGCKQNGIKKLSFSSNLTPLGPSLTKNMHLNT